MSLTVVAIIVEVLQENLQEIRVNREDLQEFEMPLARVNATIETPEIIVEVEVHLETKRVILKDRIANGREFLDEKVVFREVKALAGQNQKNTHQLEQKQKTLKNQIALLDHSAL